MLPLPTDEKTLRALWRFVMDVRNLRDAQREFWRTRDRTHLVQVKVFEKTVDAALERLGGIARSA
jgi:hypothetical protein